MNITPQIGKDVIESLTLGMYEDCRFIYREYIQNAADAVDKAIDCALLKKGEEAIHVRINKDEKSISIQDNATGIPGEKVMTILRNIAHSTKKRGEDKGFRGIGRLGGLGYCSKLIFETSYYGEPVKSIMTWDSELLKFIINDRNNREEATEVLSKVTKIETRSEDRDAHEHGIDKGKPGYIHIDAVCKPQEPESRENGDRMGEGCPECTPDLSVFPDL